MKEYGILNGIALTDTITTDCFLKDFQLTYSTLFSGVRHDSGDPFAWGEKMIAHYESLGIDPKRKTLLFSDGLDFTRADELRKAFRDRVTVAFGIGTYIANDTCEEPLNIVMKTTACNGMQVADEMVNLIVAQRAYELNSKAITTADSMLETANNLRR